jgi:hypothetical protein
MCQCHVLFQRIFGWKSYPSGPIEDWRFVEMFAGEAIVSKSCRIRSIPGVSCDYIFGGKAMDLLTPAGMSPSSSNGGFLLMIMIVCEYGWHAHICHWDSLSAPSILLPFQCASSLGPSLALRLAILAVLRLEPDSLGILAPVCSSMGFLASSISLRSFMLPLGDAEKDFVQVGNLLAIRPPGYKYSSIFNLY